MAPMATHDAFLSYSAKDKPVVHDLARRLRDRGVRVWLDDWEIEVGQSIPSRIEDGLEGSTVLVLCMSEHALGSDWAALESQTFCFRDPLNRDRRFIPLRLDDAPARGSLAQFLHVDWRERSDDELDKLVAACRPASGRRELLGRPGFPGHARRPRRGRRDRMDGDRRRASSQARGRRLAREGDRFRWRALRRHEHPPLARPHRQHLSVEGVLSCSG